MKKVSVIILNWNNWKDTLECLDSVYCLKYRLMNIIIVDNGSTDNSVLKIKKWISKHKPKKRTKFKKEIFLIQNKKNVGFAAGNNFGIKFAMKIGADYFFLLNNDVVIEPGTLSELAQILNKKKDYGIVGPAVYLYSNPHKLQFRRYRKVKTIIEDINLSGCCFLVKKEVIKKIGLLDPAFFLFSEERDFFIRAKKAGYKVLYVPTKNHTLHRFSATVLQYSDLQHYHMGRSATILFKKHPTTLIKVIFGLLIHAAKILHKNPSNMKYFIKGIVKGLKFKNSNQISLSEKKDTY